MERAAGEDVQIWHEDESWTVVRGDVLRIEPVGGRTVWVTQRASIDEALEALRPLSRVLQSVGWSGWDRMPRELVRGLAALGASRIVPHDEIAFPDADWIHDGRRPLGELVRWVEVVD